MVEREVEANSKLFDQVPLDELAESCREMSLSGGDKTNRNGASSSSSPASVGDSRKGSIGGASLQKALVDSTQSTPSSSIAADGNGTTSCDGPLLIDENILVQTIAAVEAYFSDEHVAKDAFMYKHIQRGKDGFVNIKLVSSFRRVKSLTRCLGVVQQAVRRSTKLRLNDEGTKVGRTVPLPEHIHPVTRAVDEASRTILAYSIRDTNVNMSTVERIFEKCGRITKIVIYREGDDVPNELRQQLYKMHLLTHGELIGLFPMSVIQFSSQEEASCSMSLANVWQEHFKLRLVPPVSAKKAARLKAAMTNGVSTPPDPSMQPLLWPGMPMMRWNGHTPQQTQSPIILSPTALPPSSGPMWSRGLDMPHSPTTPTGAFMQSQWRSSLAPQAYVSPAHAHTTPRRPYPNLGTIRPSAFPGQFFCQPDNSGCVYYYPEEVQSAQSSFPTVMRHTPEMQKVHQRPERDFRRVEATPERLTASPESRRPHGPAADGQRGFTRSPKKRADGKS